MNTRELIPAAPHRVRFSLSARKHVPEVAGCYALAAFGDEILYVGMAKNLQRRLCQHCDDETKRNRIRGTVATWFYFVLCDEAELWRIERGWMNQYQERHVELPPMNKVYSPIR